MKAVNLILVTAGAIGLALMAPTPVHAGKARVDVHVELPPVIHPHPRVVYRPVVAYYPHVRHRPYHSYRHHFHHHHGYYHGRWHAAPHAYRRKQHFPGNRR